ncbi:hypothetical protein D3C81_909010 [compost metagenome]
MFAILHGWRLEGMAASVERAFTGRAGKPAELHMERFSVGASLLAMNQRATRSSRMNALSFTTIASELAPTVGCVSEPDGVP